ncbi:head GIN domain-containing protein [uncultured Marixanthomonas sp.]|uniref:head GIN domain-containing protein n=1 Tax=uncultured Marixanthomonas sp. TaxID=757245 RepID=UPI0030DA11E7|tara:strand:+ start:12052 stop:12726 length:675 start_codon:yes stop_codon:yes gene_type:complete
MKLVSTILIAFITFSAFSQRMVEKNIGDFDELKVFDLIEVNLIPSEENKVVIKGENTESVKIINDNGKLKIRMQLDERFDGEETFVEVHYTDVDIIDANEGAIIVANEAITQNKIELRSQEGAKIRVGLKVNYVEMKAVTGGIIEASGLAKSQDITIRTGGIIEAMDLQTQDTNLKLFAAGEAEINASEKANIKVTAGGDVTVYGNPKEVKKKSFAGGTIRIVD